MQGYVLRGTICIWPREKNNCQCPRRLEPTKVISRVGCDGRGGGGGVECYTNTLVTYKLCENRSLNKEGFILRRSSTKRLSYLKPRANGRNFVGQQLRPNIVGCYTCYMLDPFLHTRVACCCANFEAGETFKPTTPNIASPPQMSFGVRLSRSHFSQNECVTNEPQRTRGGYSQYSFFCFVIAEA